MRSRDLNQVERARFRAAAHRHAPSRLDRAELASAILHTPRRAQCCPVERAHRLMRCARAGGLAHHAGVSCRVLERVDGDVYVLPGPVGRWFFPQAMPLVTLFGHRPNKHASQMSGMNN